jgi:hypothetical protein
MHGEYIPLAVAYGGALSLANPSQARRHAEKFAGTSINWRK